MSTADDRRQKTPKGQMSGNGSGPPIAHLPPRLRAMFEARPPLEHKPPMVKRKMPPYSGVAHLLTEDFFEKTTPDPRLPFETPKQRHVRLAEERKAKHAEDLKQTIEQWDPHKPENPELCTSDAYNTLFVARLSLDTTERKLRREFEQFGPIKFLRIVKDHEGESRGYAFIEFEKEEYMREAYKRSDGRKIDGHRVVVDVERGRTVRKWLPRRLGGGLGQTRKGGKDQNVTVSGRAGASGGSSSGGDRGGGRSEYRGGGGGDRYNNSNTNGGGGRDRHSSGGDRDRYSGGAGGDRDRYSGGGGRGTPSGGDRHNDRRRERSRSRDRQTDIRRRDRSRSRDRFR